jgi:hypothetical protein
MVAKGELNGSFFFLKSKKFQIRNHVTGPCSRATCLFFSRVHSTCKCEGARRHQRPVFFILCSITVLPSLSTIILTSPCTLPFYPLSEVPRSNPMAAAFKVRPVSGVSCLGPWSFPSSLPAIHCSCYYPPSHLFVVFIHT